MSDKPAIRLKFREPSSPIVAAPPPKIALASASTGSKSKPRSPTISTEPLVVKCGHAIAFDLFVKDPFRAERRAKAMTRDCPPCRQHRVQAEMAAAAARRAKQKKNASPSLKPRLPDGAKFMSTYDATAVRWTGSLTIDGQIFEASAGSLRRLLHKLDGIYRATITPPAIAEDPTTAKADPS